MATQPSKSSKALIIAIIATLVVAISAISIMLLVIKPAAPAEPTEEDDSGRTISVLPDYIDLQFPVDQWANTVSGNVGIQVYDLNHGYVTARVNENRKFEIDSLYKLFVALEGYLRIARHQTDADEEYLENTTRSMCLDLILRESNSACAEKMLGEIGRRELNDIYTAKGFSNTNLLEYTSTAADIALLMRTYFDHAGLSEETWNTIQDSLIGQGTDQRRGLPSGFKVATVYNKAGWYSADNENWARYHDAAIIVFPELNRYYVAVVLTENISPRDIVNLGRYIEDYVLVADGVKER